MTRDDADLPRAFITCAARAVPAVAPLLGEAERLLLDSGWRTRVPQRVVPRQGIGLEDRRRLRLASYADVDKAHAVIHVLAPARLAGSKLHRELQHALRRRVPLLLLVCDDDRKRLGVGAPSPQRVRELVREANGRVVQRLDDLPDLLDLILRARAKPTTEHGDLHVHGPCPR